MSRFEEEKAKKLKLAPGPGDAAEEDESSRKMREKKIAFLRQFWRRIVMVWSSRIRLAFLRWWTRRAQGGKRRLSHLCQEFKEFAAWRLKEFNIDIYSKVPSHVDVPLN